MSLSLPFSYTTLLGTGAGIWVAYLWLLFTTAKRKVQHIPTIGPDGFITSYISAWRYEFGKGRKMIQEGYDKYPGGVFKVPTLTTRNGWLIVANGTKLTEDIRKATDDQLSFGDASFELFQTDHLLGAGKSISDRQTPYHVSVVRGALTKGFSSRMEEIRDEFVQAVSDVMSIGTEWSSFKVHKSLLPIISRTTNRFFVGLPLCRNEEFCRIQESLTVHLVAAGTFLNLLPAPFRPIVGKLITKFPSANRKIEKHLAPLFQERMEMDAKHGRKWEGRPADVISWLLDAAPDHRRNLEDLSGRVIALNIAAIHTTSVVLCNTLFELAARQEYFAPLRSEVEDAINTYGWTKEATTKMRKVDSFIRESSRVTGITAVSMIRNSRSDFTFSNGVVVPAGFRVAVPADATHRDPQYYEDPHTFKGFRFVDESEDSEGFNLDSLRNQMVALDTTFLLFGNGRSACPGRFFAVAEIKAMLAHLLMNYDFKLPNDSREPPTPHWLGHTRLPNESAEILFRKRKE
ncbi:cytochrome P450 [Coprinopsis cinerea okayama7|uniref:Cytochrome P450 n=1 Tax=Coprinopsis cinerea (strain Okayama-7 / 130 / ATCC MYA-4618 / FGSC 9003) TaxID=240176 RepID=A8NI96_COPC7|nr:cytochrome P450 [Coprinopsis cinerea okayama7\|eukprot:XP_001833943.1 cytochrome P450 [Coprinopsis cinerea okayama7\